VSLRTVARSAIPKGASKIVDVKKTGTNTSTEVGKTEITAVAIGLQDSRPITTDLEQIVRHFLSINILWSLHVHTVINALRT